MLPTLLGRSTIARTWTRSWWGEGLSDLTKEHRELLVVVVPGAGDGSARGGDVQPGELRVVQTSCSDSGPVADNFEISTI